MQSSSLIVNEFVPLPPFKDWTSKLYNLKYDSSETQKESIDCIVYDEQSLSEFLKQTHHNSNDSETLDHNVLQQAIKLLNIEDRKYFFSRTFPNIVYLVDKTHKIFDGENRIRYLKADEAGTVVLTQEQCACILANAFLSTWPVDSSERSWLNTGLPSINYDHMFRGVCFVFT
jgi:hypothetical protein